MSTRPLAEREGLRASREQRRQQRGSLYDVDRDDHDDVDDDHDDVDDNGNDDHDVDRDDHDLDAAGNDDLDASADRDAPQRLDDDRDDDLVDADASADRLSPWNSRDAAEMRWERASGVAGTATANRIASQASLEPAASLSPWQDLRRSMRRPGERMRRSAPFEFDDLADLDARLLSRAERVVPMFDVAKGDRSRRVIGLRHDVDDNPRSFETALAFAEWEFERGYSSTYYLLHGAHYWNEENLDLVPRFVDLGHEVGIHVNAIAVALVEDDDPHRVLFRALEELRATGVPVRGCVAHGDRLCHAHRFVNDEIFTESRRPDYGAADRLLRHGNVVVQLEAVSRTTYDLEYDANWLPRADYLSDSGGSWSQRFEDVVDRFAMPEGQLHVLIHPDWWSKAFQAVPA